MESKRRHLSGLLTCPMITCWVFFGMHFIFIGLFHGIFRKYIDIYDVILNIVLLFTIEAIAVFLTLSNSRNNYKFLLISLLISSVNIILILFSIFVYVFSFFLKDKLKSFIKAESWLEKEGEWWKGTLLIVLKVIECLPFIIILIYKKKADSSPGIIYSENTPIISDNNDNDEEDETLT